MLSFAAQESIPHRDDSGHLQHDSVIFIPGIKYLAFSFYLVLSEITVMLIKPRI